MGDAGRVIAHRNEEAFAHATWKARIL